MLDDDLFKEKVISNIGVNLRSYIDTYLAKGASKETYFARNQVLCTIFETKTINGMKVMNCQASFLEVIRKTFAELFQIIKNASDYTDRDYKLNELCFVDQSDEKMTFNQVPQVLVIDENVFILHAIMLTNSTALVRRSNQKWYCFEKAKVSAYHKNSIEIIVNSVCYIAPIKDKRILKSSKLVRPKPIDIIENFHTYDMNGTKITVNNACAADSVLHCLGCIFKDDRISWNETADGGILTSLLKAYTIGDKDQVYINRVKLFVECNFDISVVNFSEISLHCTGNIFNAIQSLCIHEFPSATISRNCKCGSTIRKIASIEIDFVRLTKVGIKKLSSCILLDTATQSKSTVCKVCKSEQDTRTVFSDLIFLDLQPMTTCDEQISLPSFCLKSFPSEVKIGNSQYTPRAAIEYQANGNQKESIGHYVAHCQRNDGDWCCFDDIKKNIQKSEELSLRQWHALVLTK